jgi:predicted DNA-binding WGR domain protein
VHNPRRFELVRGTTRKFWEINLTETKVRVWHGNIGADVRPRDAVFSTPHDLAVYVEKYVRQKLRMGYRELSRAEVAATRTATKAFAKECARLAAEAAAAEKAAARPAKTTAAKKVTAKTTAAKTTAAKTTAAKTTAARKTATRKTAAKTTARKTAARKTAARKTAVKKTAAKKTAAKKVTSRRA